MQWAVYIAAALAGVDASDVGAVLYDSHVTARVAAHSQDEMWDVLYRIHNASFVQRLGAAAGVTVRLAHGPVAAHYARPALH